MVSSVEPFRAEVEQWVEENLSIQAIYIRLQRREYPGSYGSVRRFVSRLKAKKGRPKVTVRVERPPGDEAQVDFGYAGLMYDEETKKIIAHGHL